MQSACARGDGHSWIWRDFGQAPLFSDASHSGFVHIAVKVDLGQSPFAAELPASADLWCSRDLFVQEAVLRTMLKRGFDGKR